MSYFGGGGQNGGANRGGAGNPPQQTTLLTGPQLFVNSASQLQFQSGGQNFFPQGEGSQQQRHVQLNTGGAPLLLQPPVNFVTDGLGVGISQLITQGSIMNLGSVLMQDQAASGQGQGQSKQRVFTGMVTKIHDDFGFIDEEVFFQMGVVKGPILPKEGDRVLVEADYNPSMPFKWNATRVQIVNMGGGGASSVSQQSGGYQGYSGSVQKQVPPPPALGPVGGGGRPPPSMGSNPHQMYGAGGGRPPSGHAHVSGGMNDSLMGGRRPISSQMPSHLQHQQDNSLISSGLMGGLPSLMSKMDGGRERERERERDRDRKEKERVHRSRSKERGGRDRRERSRDRNERVRRSRSKSRERRRRSPSPIKRRSRDRERNAVTSTRDKSVDRERERDRRDRSSPVSKSHKSDRADRVKRSRSRDTIKSSEGKGSNLKDKSRSPSPASRRGGNKSSVISKSSSRYLCDTPKFSLDVLELNSSDMKSRYKNLYVPSDFFLAKCSWMEAFPLEKPYQFSHNSSLVHIMGRRVERLEMNFDNDSEAKKMQEKFNEIPNVLQAPDSSCTFSVKVMILSSPSLEAIFRKSGFVLEQDNPEPTETKDITTSGFQTLQRLLNFVVGVKTGKHDIMALGGNWSSSLDGPDPQSNPKVLINTAIRCCKSMASVDLTRCKYWYRFMEIYYRRSNGNLETVVYFLPDLSSCVPSLPEWDKITKSYRIALNGPDADKLVANVEAISSSIENTENKSQKDTPPGSSSSTTLPATADDNLDENWESTPSGIIVGDEIVPPPTCTTTTSGDAIPGAIPLPIAPSQPIDADVSSAAAPSDVSTLSASKGGDHKTSEPMMEVLSECNGDASVDVAMEQDNVNNLSLNNDVITSAEMSKEADGEVDIYEDIVESQKSDANKISSPGTHHSLLDLNCMTVAKLKEELALRNLNTKGLKAQLTSRLQEAIESEKEKETPSQPDPAATVGTKDVIIANNVALKQETKVEKEEINELSIVRLVDPSTILETSINERDTTEEIMNNDESSSQLPEQGELGEDEIILNHLKSTKGVLTYPVLRPDMKPEERKLWERRFALPNHPKVLIFPATKVSSSSSSMKKTMGPFDCSVMPLSSLRDYRQIDKREESFEVSLFAELFYEMLQRDFGFRIYSEIVRQTGLLKNSEKETQDDAETGSKEEEPAIKKRKTSPSTSIVPSGVVNNVDLKAKVTTVDPLLLLSFTFYDENQLGYITDSHIEDICSALGLGLTRHEIQGLLRNISAKGGVHYRAWTDKSEAETDDGNEQSLLIDENKSKLDFVMQIAKGNKSLLPVFTYSSPIVAFDDVKPTLCDDQKVDWTGESVLVTVDGKVVDVKKIMHELEKAEKEKLSAEANVNAFKNSLTESKNQVAELKKSNDSLADELKKSKVQVKNLEAAEKSNKEIVEIFKKSTESFIYRVKDVVKLPQEKKVTSTNAVVSEKSKTTKTSEPTETSSLNNKEADNNSSSGVEAK
ncbi:uncharacterized protein LOC110847903 isoform X2 [Folsomia candida]|uniref:uncharacterized protein LOC110847903 isoform X2 n=1 Tax=Folsomia candida TaxID=158441 RepID=UPI000B8EF68D|nr:uncharacterized protein LOC110847903 isoform X2 [Folsomia candida]